MTTISDNETCWRAVQARDASYDGAFVFAVRTTGIYCRPSCPARRPHRENVTFYALPVAAERAGYRPCKRCQPHRAALRDPQAVMVQRVCAYIGAHFDDPAGDVTLEALSAQVHVSPYHLQRTFKRLMGITPRQYTEALRVDALKDRLRKGATVTDALYAAGYGSSRGLYERADETLGMTPSTYGKGGAGMTIRYTVVPCALGQVLVAATARGICAVKLGDTAEELEALLGEEFDRADIRCDDDLGYVEPILRHLDGQEPHLDLPLDIQGTAFQQRVWAALRRIPYGETRTYAEIAAAIGQPKAARAVGNACGANPVPPIIPCHRAVRSDGGLGGYRWDIRYKRQLLANERGDDERD